MKNNHTFPQLNLIRAVMGYVLIIALILMVSPNQGKELAIRLANGLTPLFFFALGALLLDCIEWIIPRLKRSNGSETDA